MSFIVFAPPTHLATTRKLYEKKLQKLLDQPPAEPEAPTDVTALPKADSNQNGNTNSDQYSDKEDGEHWPRITSDLFKFHTTGLGTSVSLKTCFLFFSKIMQTR